MEEAAATAQAAEEADLAGGHRAATARQTSDHRRARNAGRMRLRSSHVTFTIVVKVNCT